MSTTKNAGRFTGLAAIYAANRPTYPAQIMTALAERAGEQPVPKTVIDIGCGTGISTRALREALPDWRIIAAEPNRDMLMEAKASCADLGAVEFVEAGAEALPAEAGSVGLILAAQALHWFDLDVFFDEAARVLAPGGTVAVLYNNRQNAHSEVLQEIETDLESIDPTYSRDYRARDIPKLLGGLVKFGEVERVRETWSRPSGMEDLVNYFMSRSMLQPLVQRVGEPEIRRRIREIIERHAEGGMIYLPMATELDTAKRR